jgi:hypothetical protein
MAKLIIKDSQISNQSKEKIKRRNQPYTWEAPYKEKMIKRDKRWGKVEFWQSLGAMKDPYTMGYIFNCSRFKI